MYDYPDSDLVRARMFIPKPEGYYGWIHMWDPDFPYCSGYGWDR